MKEKDANRKGRATKKYWWWSQGSLKKKLKLKKTTKASNIQVETVSQTFQNTVQSNAQLMRH